MQHYYPVVITRPTAALLLTYTRNNNSSTAHQFSCCMHRLKRSRTSPHSLDRQPGTLTTASGTNDAVDVSHRQELSTSSSYCCCCEPDWSWSCPTKEPIRCSRLAEHALHLGAVAARLGPKQRPRAARAEAARAGRWGPWLDSNGVTFLFFQYDRSTSCRLQRPQYKTTACCCINTWFWHVVPVVSVSYEKH